MGIPTHWYLGADSTIVSLGHTHRDATELVAVLQSHFLAGTYDLLRKNCNAFTDCAMFYLCNARLDDKYKYLEKLGDAAEKQAGIVSRLTKGGYKPNASAENFDLNQVLVSLIRVRKERDQTPQRRQSQLEMDDRLFQGAVKVGQQPKQKEELERIGNMAGEWQVGGQDLIRIRKLRRALYSLGFSEVQANEAAIRCSSVEAA